MAFGQVAKNSKTGDISYGNIRPCFLEQVMSNAETGYTNVTYTRTRYTHRDNKCTVVW